MICFLHLLLFRGDLIFLHLLLFRGASVHYCDVDFLSRLPFTLFAASMSYECRADPTCLCRSASPVCFSVPAVYIVPTCMILVLAHDITKHRVLVSLFSSHILSFYIVCHCYCQSFSCLQMPCPARQCFRALCRLQSACDGPTGLEVLEHGQRPSLEAGWRRFQLLVAVIMACPANEA